MDKVYLQRFCNEGQLPAHSLCGGRTPSHLNKYSVYIFMLVFNPKVSLFKYVTCRVLTCHLSVIFIFRLITEAFVLSNYTFDVNLYALCFSVIKTLAFYSFQTLAFDF